MSFSYDLRLFLPEAKTPAQAALLTRINDSPGSRLVMIDLPPGTHQAVDQLRQRLADTGMFTRVLSGPAAMAGNALPEPVWTYRYLLSDSTLDTPSLTQALANRQLELALFAGSDYADVVASDPTLAAYDLLAGLLPVSEQQAEWLSKDGRPLILLETIHAAFDIAAAKEALSTIKRVLNETLQIDAANATAITGIAAFGAELSTAIESEARWRSLLASVAIVLVVFAAYRRPAYIIIGALPLITGVVVGATLLALVFGRVHGITLAFGFTLLGIAIDYPLHLFSHARHAVANQAMREIWPTMRLGAISTVLAYMAIALSGATGPSQLGVFTATGVIAALMTTRYILPRLMTPAVISPPKAATMAARRLRLWPAALLTLLAIVIVSVSWQQGFWEDDLATLSPVPAEKIAHDTSLRARLGTVDTRHLVVINAQDVQQVLERTESLVAAMRSLTTKEWLSGLQAVTSLVPSVKSQLARQASLPLPESLNDALTRAAKPSGFSVDALQPFADAVKASRTLAPLDENSYVDSEFGALVAGLLRQEASGWSSTILLHGLKSPELLRQWSQDRPEQPLLIDLRSTSASLVAAYRDRTLWVCAFAYLGIAFILLWRLSVRRATWALTTVVASVAGTCAVVYASSGPLSLYHVMGLLLVAGLGLDYALFTARAGTPASLSASRHAVDACAASTVLAFGILGVSAIPALSAIGMTVSVGTALSYVVVRAGAVARVPIVAK